MTTIANIIPTPAIAAIQVNVDVPRRPAPGVGLVLAGVVSVALWAGLAQFTLGLVG